MTFFIVFIVVVALGYITCGLIATRHETFGISPAGEVVLLKTPKQVFCIDCTHCDIVPDHATYASYVHCKASTKEVDQISFYRKKTYITSELMRDKNRHNDCKDFKAKGINLEKSE